MSVGRKVKVILGVLAALGLVALWQGGSYWYKKGYSRGSRTGVIRKISVKGPPYCKYLSGEMAVIGSAPGQPAEIWEFSVDHKGEANPVVQSLHVAERTGKTVTLAYRQDLKMWWRCNPAEYFITAIE